MKPLSWTIHLKLYETEQAEKAAKLIVLSHVLVKCIHFLSCDECTWIVDWRRKPLVMNGDCEHAA
jgi:hypothetical protein